MPSVTLSPKQQNFTEDPCFVEIETTQMTGGGPYVPAQTNLYCWLEIYAGIGPLEKVGLFLLPYSTVNKKTQFDLSSVITWLISPPAPSILNTNTFSISNVPTVQKVSFTYADAWGVPLQPPTALTSTDEYYFVAGGTKYFQGFGTFAIPQMLHSRLDKRGKAFPKEVRKNQPEIINYWSPASDTSVAITITFYYTDGTTNTATRPAFTASAGKVTCATIGWNQLGLDADVITAKKLAYYKINFTGLVATRDELLFQLDDRDLPELDRYLLFDNGIGGFEIARFSGYHSERLKSKSDMTIKPRVANINFQDGLIQKDNSSGYVEHNLVSGYYSKSYCQELAQLALRECWQCDLVRQKFYKIYVSAGDITLIDEDDDISYISIKYREHDRTNHHNWRY